MRFKSTIRSIYLTLRARTLGAINKACRQRVQLPQGPIKTIAIACQDRIGDAVVSLPAMAAMRKRYPDAKIICFAVEYVAGMIAGQGYVDKVIILKNRLVADILNVFKLRKDRPDLGLDLQTDYTMRNALLLAAAGVRFSLGYNVNGRGLFYTKSLEPPPEDTPMVDCLLNVSREAGALDIGRMPVLHVSEQERRDFSNNHGDLAAPQQRLVGIHPGGHYKTQRWPDERFAATADALIDGGTSVVLIGGDRERTSIERIRATMKRQPFIFIPRDTKELMAVISFCKVLVCNNSGPLHIASALQVPTVSTMGPTDAQRWRPLGPRNHVLRKNIPCISCNSGICRVGTMECMDKITVDEMVAAVNEVL